MAPRAALEKARDRRAGPRSLLAAFLTATADPTRIGILSDQRESKEHNRGYVKILPAAEAAEFLTATLDLQDFR